MSNMNISSKIFKEYDIRGVYPQEISGDVARALARAFAKMFKLKKIIVGRDARVESEKVFWPLVQEFMACGVKVSDLGVCATPELFFAVGAKKFPAGVMVTASHSPNGQTGFKFCDGRGQVLGLNAGLKRLSALAKGEVKSLAESDKIKNDSRLIDFSTVVRDYEKFASSFFRPQDVKGFRIVLDASGGSGARLADDLFEKLPLKATYINFRAGDKYPDHGPNPLLPENQKVIIREIKNKKADLGVIFDGDADRTVFFDELGNFIEPYYINCLLSQIILSLRKNIKIVVDARLVLAISQVIKNNQGQVFVHRSGYANFIKTMTEKKLLFGCENSGHFIINFLLKSPNRSYVYGDGLIPVFLLLKYLKKSHLTLSRAVEPFKKLYVVSGELNFIIKNFQKVEQNVRRQFSGNIFSSIDGLSVTDPKKEWFFNLRLSHTEPVVRLNIESRSHAQLLALKKKLTSLIK
ncbi:MAG: hypothetical protein WC516_00115 [Patescibacteria group bacterium]